MKMVAFECDECGTLYKRNDKRGITHIIKCGDMVVVIKNVIKDDKEIDICANCLVGEIKESYQDA